MPLKLIITKGLPGSGKTTWARAYLQAHPETVNLCKDDLRQQFADTDRREDLVIQIRDRLTIHYLRSRYSVIWSDTNLNPFHTDRARELAEQNAAEFQIQDFTKVPLNECIRRDAQRASPVGQNIIEQMHCDYLL
jgi:predicted kinase